MNSLKPEAILWFTSIDNIKSEQELYGFVKNLSTNDQSRVYYYKFFDDQRRSFLSILLQRKLIKFYWDLEDGNYEINRTSENKPFLSSLKSSQSFWNYNVSHHGQYVAIASHCNKLVGVDLVDVSQRSRGFEYFNNFIDIFTNQFHPMEIQTMKLAECEYIKYINFYVNWALKEAFVKAKGVGLGYPLNKTRFYIIYNEFVFNENFSEISLQGNANLFLNEIKRDDWSFEFKSIDNKHVIALCFGPINDAADSYKNACWTTIDNKNDVSTLSLPIVDIKINSIIQSKCLLELL